MMECETRTFYNSVTKHFVFMWEAWNDDAPMEDFYIVLDFYTSELKVRSVPHSFSVMPKNWEFVL